METSTASSSNDQLPSKGSRYTHSNDMDSSVSVCIAHGIDSQSASSIHQRQPCHTDTNQSRHRSRTKAFTKPLAIGGLRSTVLALTTSALGAGVFTMPYGFSRTGLFSGLFMLGLCASVSGLSLQILLVSISHYQCDSYSALARRIISPSAGILVDAIVTFNGMAVGAVFLIFLADFIPDILISAFGPQPYFSTSLFRAFVLIAVVLLAFPLSVRKGYGALRNITLIYVSSIVLTIAIVALKAPFLFSSLINHGTDSTGQPIHYYWWNISWDSCKAFNICLFAFMQHQNAVPIFKEMTTRTQERSTLVTVGASIAEFLLYGVLGAAGYLSFLSTTQQNFINSYPKNDIPILICRLLLSICLMFAIPMAMISTASSMRRLLKKLHRRIFPTSLSSLSPSPTSSSSSPSSIDCQYQVLEDAESPRRSEGSASTSLDNNVTPNALVNDLSPDDQSLTSPATRRVLSVAFILLFDLFVALITKQVAFLVSFIGGCFSVTLMCGLPLLIYKNGIGLSHTTLRYATTVTILLTFFLAGLGSCVAIVFER